MKKRRLSTRLNRLAARADGPLAEVVELFREVDRHCDIRLILNPEAHLRDDVGLDSLGFIQLIMALEDKAGRTLPDDEAGGIATINDIIKYFDPQWVQSCRG